MITNPIADLTNAMVTMLKKEEGVILIGGIYDDLKAGEHNPTIGIGINLKSNPAYVALVLQELGVFAASDATVTGAETEAQRNARYNAIVGRFTELIDGASLNRLATNAPGTSVSEINLQNALNLELDIYIPGGTFTLNDPHDVNVLRGVIDGFNIGTDMNGAATTNRKFLVCMMIRAMSRQTKRSRCTACSNYTALPS